MEYQGAFRVSTDTFGGSSLLNNEGPIAYHHGHQSLFIAGDTEHQAVAEFSVPFLSKSTSLSDLEMVTTALQPFAPVFEKLQAENGEHLDRIGGLQVLSDGGAVSLMVNCYKYNDSIGDNHQAAMLIRDADNIDQSEAVGFHTLRGGAGHTSGWISCIPPKWRKFLYNATHVVGQSSGIPNMSRCSVGPSAFAFNENEVLAGERGCAADTCIYL